MAILTMASLEYYIIECVLRGTVARKPIQFFAVSGGAAGSSHGHLSPAANNPYFEGLKTNGYPGDPKHVHGGPIPPGWYWVRRSHVSRKVGRCAELSPEKGTDMIGRDTRNPFLIHRAGPHGSDGCIVPIVGGKTFQDFMDALDRDGGGTLYVDESIEGFRFA